MMVRMEILSGILPPWFKEWFQIYLVPLFKIEGRQLLSYLFKGVGDILLFLGLPLFIGVGSEAFWSARYSLLPEQQQQVLLWASFSDLTAYVEDIPPVVPLVLWYKEGGLQAKNPDNCEGIMGFYTAVKTGQVPCYPPGPISPFEVAHQLQDGARIFKEYCPEIHYTTSDPALIKQCYLYYNAGPRTRLTADSSGYVMNGYDAAHQNMVLTDIQGRQYRLKALGAWPVHLAIQAQLAGQKRETGPSFLLAPGLLLQEAADRIWAQQTDINTDPPAPEATPRPRCQEPETGPCLVAPHLGGDPGLRPSLNPLIVPPSAATEPKCGVIPGSDLGAAQPALVLAPMQGNLTRYTDAQGNLAIQIENAEWTVWLIGLRSYVAEPGPVTAGQPIGAIGGLNSSTPAVHYAVYDKAQTGFVDPLSFLPEGECPPLR